MYIETEVANLHQHGVHVFSMVSDNCQAYLNDCAEFEPNLDMYDGEWTAEWRATLPAVFETETIPLVQRRGIFALNCAAHSLQLVMKDFNDIPCVANAKLLLETALDHFGKSPEQKNHNQTSTNLYHQGWCFCVG